MNDQRQEEKSHQKWASEGGDDLMTPSGINKGEKKEETKDDQDRIMRN